MVLALILGLIVGSFLNAVIFRLSTGESFLSGRSHCPRCGHKLTAVDLIPVLSFIFLRGKCRYCKSKISWQYPLIELATAISFILLAQNFEFRISNFEFIAQAIFICFLIVISIYDLKHYLILDKVVFPALVLSIAYNLLIGQLVSGILGAVLVSGFFYLQYLFSKGRWIGFGDVKFGLLLGSLFGFPLALLVLLLAYCSGAMVGVSLIALGKKKLSSKLPFGTFLGFSAIIVLLYGDQIWNWYMKLIGF